MATVHRRFEIPADASAVWKKMADLGAVHELFGMLVDAEVDGDRRVCRTADGSELAERIIAVDPENRRIAYTITDSPFGFEFHAASWQAVPSGDGKTTFEWFTDVKPDGAAEVLANVIDGERDGLVAALAK